MNTPTVSPVGFFPAELLRMLGSARRVIDQHVSDQRSCAYCGALWPCQRAQQAEFALAAL